MPSEEVFAFRSLVVHGRGEGRLLGFPTANLEIGALKNPPKPGVYFSAVLLRGALCPAVTDVGSAPTLNTGRAVIAECHIIGFSGNIYSQELTVVLVKHLRDEVRFDSPEALEAAVAGDIAAAKAMFADLSASEADRLLSAAVLCRSSSAT